MKYRFLILLIIVSFSVFAQNIGQKGDTIINYTDINGLKQGFWQQKYYNQKLKYEGYFKNDKPYGELKRYSDRGKLVAILNYDNTGDTANAQLYHENEKIAATGRYINKIKDGEWKYYNEKGKLVLLETLKMGDKNGLYEMYYPDDNVYHRKNYENGKLHGEEVRYYENGQENYKANYIKGKRVGKFFVYNQEGKVLVFGKYVDDKRHGDWYYYEDNGKLITTIKYKYGKAENEDELRKIETEEIRKLENNKGTIDDPELFIENPEQYMLKHKGFRKN